MRIRTRGSYRSKITLSNTPANHQELELNVRVVKGGARTTYIHKSLKFGDKISLTRPLGRFFVRKSDPQPVIFMAGGSGLSSPKPMILDHRSFDVLITNTVSGTRVPPARTC